MYTVLYVYLGMLSIVSIYKQCMKEKILYIFSISPCTFLVPFSLEF